MARTTPESLRRIFPESYQKVERARATGRKFLTLARQPVRGAKVLGKRELRTGKYEFILKIIISLILDVIDFFIGRIPVFGTVFDFFLSFIGVMMWGPIGLLSFWEVFDFTDQLDGFIPTLTISGIVSSGVLGQFGSLFRRGEEEELAYAYDGGKGSEEKDYYKKGYKEALGERRVQLGFIGSIIDSIKRNLGYLAKPAVVVLLIIGLWFFMTSDTFKRTWPEVGAKTEVALAGFNFPKMFQRAISYPKEWFFSYLTGIGEFGPPEVEREKKIDGVKILEFKGKSLRFFEGDEIVLIGTAEIDSIDKDANVLLSCNLQKKDNSLAEGRISVAGRDENKINIQKNVGKIRRNFECVIPAVDKVDHLNFSNYVVNLDWYYDDFQTVTRLKALTSSRAFRDKKEQAEQDALYGFRENKYITKNNYALDVCEEGCGLSYIYLKLQSDMPLVEESDYYLDVGFTGILFGKMEGNMKKLEGLFIDIPDNLELNDDGCEAIGDLILDSSDSYWNYFNEELKKEELDNFGFVCKLKVVNVQDRIIPGFITAKGVFDYGGRIKSDVTVFKKVG